MIYKRYLMREMAKTFFFLLGAIGFLFIFIDLLINKKIHPAPVMHMLAYECALVMTMLDQVTPFLLLISTLSVCTCLASRQELVVLLTGGLSKRQLLHPLLKFALYVMFFLYLHAQWISPYAHRYYSSLYTTYIKPTSHADVSALTLPQDGSQLIYASYDPLHHTLHDVYWLQNRTAMWHLKWLDLESATGHFVDRLHKTSAGWAVEESFPLVSSLTLALDERMLQTQLLPPSSLSLFQLWRKTNSHWQTMPDSIAKISTRFYQKLTFPFAALFAVLLPLPFCFNFSRQLPISMLFFWSLLGGICYLVVMNVSTVLGESQLIAPSLALCLPTSLMAILSVWSYACLE